MRILKKFFPYVMIEIKHLRSIEGEEEEEEESREAGAG